MVYLNLVQSRNLNIALKELNFLVSWFLINPTYIN